MAHFWSDPTFWVALVTFLAGWMVPSPISKK